MWDTADERTGHRLSHDMPCTKCGHAMHTFLACSEVCDCEPPGMPGSRIGGSPSAHFVMS